MSRTECPHCDQISTKEDFCNFCNGLLPIDQNKSFFKILDLKESFEINYIQMQKNFIEKISLYHPDRFAMASQLNIEIANLNASILNKALQTLSNITKRAKHLLSLNGIYINQEDSLGSLENFLEDMMALQMEVESVSLKQECFEIVSKIKLLMDNNYDELCLAFSSNHFKKCAFLVSKRKFFDRLLENIKIKINQIED